jgi:hypothetical protein
MGLEALKLLAAGALVVVTVAIHAVGFSLLLRAMVSRMPWPCRASDPSPGW